MLKQTNYVPSQHFELLHPGELLAEKIEELELSAAEFSEASGIPLQELNLFLNGEKAVDEAFAIALEKATQTPAAFWLRFQKSYSAQKLQYVSKSKADSFFQKPMLRTTRVSRKRKAAEPFKPTPLHSTT